MNIIKKIATQISSGFSHRKPKVVSQWSIGGNPIKKDGCTLCLYNIGWRGEEVDSVYIRLSNRDVRNIMTVLDYCLKGKEND